MDAIKKSLAEPGFDKNECLANLQLLKAVINGLKKFGAAYMSQAVGDCIDKDISKSELEGLMQLAIDTGFDI